MDTLHALMKGPLPSLFFCIGNPVVGNPTQYMMEKAFLDMDFPGQYITCEVESDQLQTALEGLKALHVAGGNVTAPFKQQVFPYLDSFTESARLSNAVNCITLQEDGTYQGDNTDGKGFLQSLKARAGNLHERRVVLFGSGGAASAIAVELVLSEVKEVILVNRTRERAEGLAERLQGITRTRISTQAWEGTYQIEEDGLVVVQATSVGLFDEKGCIDVAFSHGLRDVIACDVVFNPSDTAFLKRARQAGAATLDGLGMLVNQGVLGIENWTGRKADAEVMRAALTEAFSL
ncbi:shikimate dehydrogenase [uncultured Sphaerochaeta sp.]|uniref:shikimate dehydrogenase n=1 Tax=uncultured Sphaerochaeta sp. TaxID=886478 RepID=UPI002AA77AE2|nr:shikimate dehydrogenase [uncultured Sphaerochaeta sp.]